MAVMPDRPEKVGAAAVHQRRWLATNPRVVAGPPGGAVEGLSSPREGHPHRIAWRGHEGVGMAVTVGPARRSWVSTPVPR